jgi:hypothetical protein
MMPNRFQQDDSKQDIWVPALHQNITEHDACMLCLFALLPDVAEEFLSNAGPNDLSKIRRSGENLIYDADEKTLVPSGCDTPLLTVTSPVR